MDQTFVICFLDIALQIIGEKNTVIISTERFVKSCLVKMLGMRTAKIAWNHGGRYGLFGNAFGGIAASVNHSDLGIAVGLLVISGYLNGGGLRFIEVGEGLSGDF